MDDFKDIDEAAEKVDLSVAEVFKEEALQKIVDQIMNIRGNNCCVECGDKDPQWASYSLGSFICITCSGIHRNLGVHLSRVKSMIIDNWKREELQSMKSIGNLKSKREWFCSVPLGFEPPIATDPVILKEYFIKAKYIRKLFQKEKDYTQYGLVKQGLLVKQGNVVKNWKKRHFLLWGSLLYYCKNSKDAKPAGLIPLQEVTSIDCQNDPLEGKTHLYLD